MGTLCFGCRPQKDKKVNDNSGAPQGQPSTWLWPSFSAVPEETQREATFAHRRGLAVAMRLRIAGFLCKCTVLVQFWCCPGGDTAGLLVSPFRTQARSRWSAEAPNCKLRLKMHGFGPVLVLFRRRHSGITLCYATVLPAQKSVFRAGFRPDSSRESPKIGSPGQPNLRLSRLETGRNPARKPHIRPGSTLA